MRHNKRLSIICNAFGTALAVDTKHVRANLPLKKLPDGKNKNHMFMKFIFNLDC